MRHDWIAILSLLAVAATPVSSAGCSSKSGDAVSSEQSLRGRGGDRDADVDEVADEAARGDAGHGRGDFDRDKDSDELADEADGGRRDHECRDGGGWNGSRDAGESWDEPTSPFGRGPGGRR